MQEEKEEEDLHTEMQYHLRARNAWVMMSLLHPTTVQGHTVEIVFRL